jgi:hypothetical protein
MSKNGSWGGLSNRNFKQSMSYLPNPAELHTIDFQSLDGGLNIYNLNYRLRPNESPDVKNMRWKDGALSSRKGQQYLIDQTEAGETGYAAAEEFFWGYGFVHVDDEIRCFAPSSLAMSYTVLKTGVPQNRGTFFRYGDNLMYKNKGGYYQIGYNPSGSTPAQKFPVTAYSDHEFVPVTYINCKPATGAGDSYQPQNRLSNKAEMWYSAESGVADYFLPYGTTDSHVSSVTKVVVDGVTQATSAYTVTISTTNKTAKVHFNTAPPVSNPFVANTVRITYQFTGTDAKDSIMDCPYAIVYGGDQNLCVVVGGCPAQPNAYFWSGNDQYAMNPFYFPMEHYNFAGDTESAVVGFGKQQGFLVVLSTKGIGRAKFGTTTTNSERLQIEMPYTAINSKIGCQYPWSIQLVENNICYLNDDHGLCFIADSSAAYENNIVPFSRKINGAIETAKGLLYDLFRGGDAYSVVYDDCYHVITNQHAYVWDFRLSSVNDPSFFYYTNIRGVSFIHGEDPEDLYHIDNTGSLSQFTTRYNDYGEAIEKVYQFATQMMGTYDRLKDMRSVLLSLRSDTGGGARVKYITDYEDRYDLTPISVWSWSLAPLNLNRWDISVVKFALVVRRNPMCRHIRHFALRLENDTLNQDMSVISAQMQYVFVGRQR